MSKARATKKLTMSFGDDMGIEGQTSIVIHEGDELILEDDGVDGLYSVIHLRTGIMGIRLTEQEFERV